MGPNVMAFWLDEYVNTPGFSVNLRNFCGGLEPRADV